jgi:uncharacterized coiled-coil protein SlyX
LPDKSLDLLEEIAAAQAITLDELTDSILRDAIEQQKVLDLQSENS